MSLTKPSGDLSSAVDYLEKFYNLTTEQEWQDKIGDNLHDIASLQVLFIVQIIMVTLIIQFIKATKFIMIQFVIGSVYFSVCL